MKCEVCGSSDLIKENGVFVCKDCGMKYTLDEVKKLNKNSSPVKSTDKSGEEPAEKQEEKAGNTVKINGRTYSKPAGDGNYSKKSAAVSADAPKQEPAKPVDAKLVKWANTLAVIAVILGTVRFAVRCIGLSFATGIYELAMLLVAAGAVKGIRKGKYRAGALMRVPAAMLGYDAFAVIIPFFFGLEGFSVPDLVPLLRDVLLILMLVFMKKELPEGRTVKSMAVTGIVLVNTFGLANLLRYLAGGVYFPEGVKAPAAEAFLRNIKVLFSNPFASLEGRSMYLADKVNSVTGRYFFLIDLLIFAAVLLVLIARGRGEVEKSTDAERGKTKDACITCIALSLAALLCSYLGGLITSNAGGNNNGSGRGPGSTCMVDGCDRPAVGPTYEFCSKHKKSLDTYWNYENRN